MWFKSLALASFLQVVTRSAAKEGQREHSGSWLHTTVRAGLQAFRQHPRQSVSTVLTLPGHFSHGLDFPPCPVVPCHSFLCSTNGICIGRHNFDLTTTTKKQRYVSMSRVCLIYCSENWWFRNTSMTGFIEEMGSGNNLFDFKGNFSRGSTSAYMTTLEKN